MKMWEQKQAIHTLKNEENQNLHLQSLSSDKRGGQFGWTK